MILAKFRALQIATILSISLLTSTASIAQTINYDDLYKELDRLSPQQAFFRLFQFQSQNPHFANTYVQLGHASEKVLKNIDPLRDFELANYWVGNAVLYYSLFSHYLQSNEVRRYRELYANIPVAADGRKIENEDVLYYVQQRMAYCTNYRDSVTLIYKALEKSKDHYNNCVRMFTQMNDSYDNINELLLQANNASVNSLENLGKQYKQSIESFDNYRSLIQKYPIAGYNQSYLLKKIETYRLDGLTNSDFLKDTFDLWDYGQWVDNVLNTYYNDIISLRYEISSIQKMFNDNKRRLSLMEYVSLGEEFSSFDELFMFRLGKYDNSSLVRELFRYLNERQNYLILDKLPLNNPNDSAYAVMNRKIRFYHRMAMQHLTTQNSLNIFRESINPDRVKRFWDFFEQEYNGIGGLLQFKEREDVFLNQTMNLALQNLKGYLDLQKTTRALVGNATSTRGFNIPLYPVTPDVPNYKSITYNTKYINEVQGEPRFVSGFLKRTGQTPIAFAAKISPDRKIEWVREIGGKTRVTLPQGDEAKQVFEADKGCITLVTGKDASSKWVNSIVMLDDKGRDKLNKRLEIEDEAVFYHYDEIIKVSTLGFASQTDGEAKLYQSFTIASADSLGNIKWKTPLDINGQLIDIIRTENGYLAFFNFTSHQIDGRRVNAGSSYNHMAHIMVELTNDGLVTKSIPILSNQSYRIERVYSISSDEVNLIGYSTDPNQIESKIIYLIMSSKGNIVYKNFTE